MINKWALGIEPRNFCWILQDRLAVCERPGGHGESHRKVRRIEEINWIRHQGFSRVVSLMPSTHNLHSYSEQNIRWSHWPISDKDEYDDRLGRPYVELHLLLNRGEKLLLHRRRLGDDVCGFIAGYFLWQGMVETESQVLVAIEKMTQRPIGAVGRRIVSAAACLAAPDVLLAARKAAAKEAAARANEDTSANQQESDTAQSDPS